MQRQVKAGLFRNEAGDEVILNFHTDTSATYEAAGYRLVENGEAEASRLQAEAARGNQPSQEEVEAMMHAAEAEAAAVKEAAKKEAEAKAAEKEAEAKAAAEKEAAEKEAAEAEAKAAAEKEAAEAEAKAAAEKEAEANKAGNEGTTQVRTRNRQ